MPNWIPLALIIIENCVFIQTKIISNCTWFIELPRTVRSHNDRAIFCCWLCEYVLATQNMCVLRSHSLSSPSLSCPSFSSSPLRPCRSCTACNFHRNYGNSNQVAWQLAVGERHEACNMPGIADWQPTSWPGWQARDRINIASCAGGQPGECVCGCGCGYAWCCLRKCLSRNQRLAMICLLLLMECFCLACDYILTGSSNSNNSNIGSSNNSNIGSDDKASPYRERVRERSAIA